MSFILPLLAWLRSRFAEPSTWNGLGGGLATASMYLAPPWQSTAVMCAGVCFGIGVVMREKGLKSSQEVFADALEAARQVAAVKDAGAK